jgi:diguanylate cyclase (GGDEF)-like protein
MLLRLKNGRIIKATSRVTPNGGWVSAHEDVTERLHYEDVLREQSLLFDAALENMPHGLCLYDKDLRVIVSNQRYREIYNLSAEDTRPGTPMLELIRKSTDRGVHVSDTDPEQLLANILRWKEQNPDRPYLRHLGDGRVISVRFQRMANGGWVSTFEDVSERERAVQELREQHRRFDVALNNMAHGLCMIDADMRIIVCNRRYVEMFGMSHEVVKAGAHMRDVLAHSIAIGNHPGLDADAVFNRLVEGLARGDIAITRTLASGRIIRITYEVMPEGGWVAIYEDVTERHKVEQSIAHMARHDALTELPNRVLFREKMAEGLARVEARGESMALFCLDLDNFKTVNDTLGHPIGDKLLRTIAERLSRAIGADDTIARLGGDEFAILQAGADSSAAEALAQRVIAVVGEPIVIDGHEINSGVSIGIALAPHDGTAADHLLKCADLALYRAKAEGRNTSRFFEADMDARIRSRRALELDLRRALTAGEFSLYYQPQIDLASNELIGMEALLRWNHPERGAVAPSEFIPIAEDMGFIVPLGEWVLRQACTEAARWPDHVRIAVNLSPVQFRNRGLITTVTQALAAARLAPQRLELEITEAVLLQEDDAVVAMLHQLRGLGVRISMDDFGTGYSSLSYLRSFPFDKIKIDRSFISDLGRNRDSAAIVRAIANLGASLGIETTAEGIETDEQLELVRRAGCTGMQGYLTSPPRPAADVPELIARLRGDEAAA